MKKILNYLQNNYIALLFAFILLFFPFLFAFSAANGDLSFRITINLLYAGMVALTLFLCQGKLRKFLAIAFLVIAFAPNMIVQSFLLTDDYILCSTNFWVVFNTNPDEAGNLFATLPLKVFVWAAIYIASIAFSLYLLFKKTNNSNNTISLYVQFPIVVVIIGMSLINPFRSKVPMIDFYKSFYKYQREMREVAEFYKNRETISLDVTNTLPEGKKTFLIIIGESQNRKHMQLYGYTRQTNPKLTEISNELAIYTNVCSPDIQTLPCLKQILTFANYEHRDLYKKEANIIEILRAGGYKTFWFDNQSRTGNGAFAIDTYTPTSYRTMAKRSDVYSDEKSCSRDSAILPQLREALLDTTEQKVIFLHLVGNHFEYSGRYENSFAKFNTKEGICSPFVDELTAAEIATVNAYDNATLYNDYIVYSCLDMLRAQDGICAMLYFSDHGEEVYDCYKKSGRSFGEGITPTSCEIPLILWTNDTYKQANGLYINTSVPTCTDDIIYGMMDLCGVKYHMYDATKSIFQPSYMPKERYVQGMRYDDIKAKFPQ